MKKVKDNRGVSLIELIVVVAIMMILLSTAVLSFSLISKRKVTNAASSTKSMIKLAQTYSKNKGFCKMTMEGLSDGGSEMYIWTSDYYNKGDNTKWTYGNGPETINKKISTKVEIQKKGTNTIEDVSISSGVKVDIVFDRKTGGFTEECKAYAADGSLIVEGTPVKIIFSNDVDKKCTLILSKNTGLVTFEK